MTSSTHATTPRPRPDVLRFGGPSFFPTGGLGAGLGRADCRHVLPTFARGRVSVRGSTLPAVAGSRGAGSEEEPGSRGE